MRSGHAARGIQIPAAAFDQVVIEQGKNVVRRNPAALRIDDAKAIRIAIGRQPDLRFVRDHGFGEALEVLLGDVGAGALEENIALGANGLVPGDAVFLECAIEIAGAAAVQRVVDDARRVLPFQFTETNELAEPREIRRSEIHLLEGACIVPRRESRGFLRGPRIELCGARFDIARDFGQGRPAIGRRKFQAVILRRIVAGGEVDGAIDFAAANLEGRCGRGRGGRAKQRTHAALGEFRGRRAREFLREEARVVRHEQRGARIAAQDVFGDGRDRDAHIAEREILGNDSAPAGGAKFYGTGRHLVSAAPYCILAPRCTTAKRDCRKQIVKRRAEPQWRKPPFGKKGQGSTSWCWSLAVRGLRRSESRERSSRSGWPPAPTCWNLPCGLFIAGKARSRTPGSSCCSSRLRPSGSPPCKPKSNACIATTYPSSSPCRSSRVRRNIWPGSPIAWPPNAEPEKQVPPSAMIW